MTIQEGRNAKQPTSHSIGSGSHLATSTSTTNNTSRSNGVLSAFFGSLTAGASAARSASHHHHHQPSSEQQEPIPTPPQHQQPAIAVPVVEEAAAAAVAMVGVASDNNNQQPFRGERPLQNGCEDKWSWSKRDRSKEVWLSGANNRTVHFHPNWSKGTAGIRGTRVLNNGRYYWELSVSQRVFGTRLSYDNYETWKRRARQFLTREGLWSYVVGDAKAEVKKSPEWAVKDDLALQTIGYLVDDALQREIEDAVTAKEAWEMLRKYFVKDSSVGKVALIKRLSKMELAEGGDVREFLLAMEELFEKMGNVGVRMDEDLKACFILANLPESYDSTVASIHGRMDVLSMNFVKTKLMEEYDRRKDKRSQDTERERQWYPVVCSTAAKTEMVLTESRRDFVNLQDRCRAVIIKHIKTREKLDRLNLPYCITNYLAEALSDCTTPVTPLEQQLIDYYLF
ncbi:uncharacterized protein LOC6036649 [Culex quinquefasciatus]|uniref:uncharacterized protein LOC6036649 n=1 Tax=Culex quinquefasciatus TaxID=7176 RepID=UPI0018E31ED3|nr:uncharacterized protein LOC6036649 [Culex quinquefasciatus]